MTSSTETEVRADLGIHDPSGARLLVARGWTDTRVRLPAPLVRLRVDPAHELLSEPWSPGPAAVAATLTCRQVNLDRVLPGGDDGLWTDVVASLVLGAAERAEWRRLRGTPRARRWLAGRIAAKDAVRCLPAGDLAGALPADLPLDVDDLGAPTVRDRAGTGYPVTIAHTGALAVAVVDPHGSRIGVDIELLSRAPAGLGASVVSPEESRDAGLGELDDEAALRLWCAKEAAAKSLGHGLPAGPASMLVRTADPLTGVVELSPGPTLEAVDASLRGTHVVADTVRDHDLIVAIAHR